jgi:hypothetical protein
MKVSQVQDYAIQARMAVIVGAKTFDRLFSGIRFDEVDGPMLYPMPRTNAALKRSKTNFPCT